jgi:hypothetical protein
MAALKQYSKALLNEENEFMGVSGTRTERI